MLLFQPDINFGSCKSVECIDRWDSLVLDKLKLFPSLEGCTRIPVVNLIDFLCSVYKQYTAKKRLGCGFTIISSDSKYTVNTLRKSRRDKQLTFKLKSESYRQSKDKSLN